MSMLPLDRKSKSCYYIRAKGVLPRFAKKQGGENLIRRRIEVVVTRTTRNRFVWRQARGFESHRLRQNPHSQE